jgi:hypothetical protein
MAAEFTLIGKNVKAARVGDEIIIKINTKAKKFPSKSGKTQVLGTTNGNKDFEGGSLGVNFYFKED